jgi:hypothetical protein
MTGSPIAMHFGQKMQSKKELVDSEEDMTKCLCPECPTNPEDGLFCVRGLTSKPIEQVRALGCDCALCSIFHEYKLSGCYLCLNKATSAR